MTELSETSLLLGSHWPTVLDIERAREHLDEELLALLLSMESTLAQQDWWSRQWTFRQYRREIFIGNTKWQDAEGHWPLWMGIYGFDGDHVFGPLTPPIFYFRCRKNYDTLGDVLREKLRAEGHEVLEDHRHLVHRAVLQCPADRAAVASYPAQAREQMLALFTEYVDFAMRHEDVVRAHIKREA